jgi:uncharacterized DUF497 family protein
MLKFEWSEHQDRTNRAKHGISFVEAQSVFYDEQARQFYDHEHADDEDRFVMLGMSVGLRILVVVHTFRRNADVIRNISARKATRNERKYHTGGAR